VVVVVEITTYRGDKDREGEGRRSRKHQERHETKQSPFGGRAKYSIPARTACAPTPPKRSLSPPSFLEQPAPHSHNAVFFAAVVGVGTLLLLRLLLLLLLLSTANIQC